MSEIPRDVWRQIGKAPTLTLSADQWHERGYVLVDGVVYRYGIDRKEQFDTLLGSWPLEAFLTSDAPAKARAWARKLSESTEPG